MPHIFISYAKKDTRPIAEKLFTAINSMEGFSAWMDKSLEAGDSWALQIQTEIYHADLVLVLLSPDVNRHPTATQRRSFVLNEIDFAQQLHKPIVPIMVQHTISPVQIAGIEYIDFTKNEQNGMTRLIRLLDQKFGKQGSNNLSQTPMNQIAPLELNKEVLEIPKYLREKREAAWEGTEQSRRLAIDELIKFTNPLLVVEILIDIMNHAPFVDIRVYAAITLETKYKDERALAGLFLGLKERNPYWDRVLGIIISYEKTAINGLIEILDTEYAEARYQAVRLLGVWNVQDAANKLLEMLAVEKIDKVYRAIATTLSQLGDTRAVPILVDKVLSTRDGDTFSTEIVESLRAFRDPRTIPVMLFLLKKRANFLKFTAQSALHELGRDIISFIEAELSVECANRNFDYLSDLLEVTAELGYPEFYDAAFKYLSCGDSTVRRNAVSTLGKIGDARATEIIGNFLLTDSSITVKHACITALVRIQAHQTTTYLIKALDDKDINIRVHAIEALAYKDTEEAVDILINLLADNDNPLQLKVASELSESQNEKAQAAVKAFREASK